MKSLLQDTETVCSQQDARFSGDGDGMQQLQELGEEAMANGWQVIASLEELDHCLNDLEQRYLAQQPCRRLRAG